MALMQLPIYGPHRAQLLSSLSFVTPYPLPFITIPVLLTVISVDIMSTMEFTVREQRMMALAWRCFDGNPKVDYDKLARLNGMTNKGSAKNAWTKIRKKLAGELAATPTGNKRAPKKRTREDSDDSDQTPTKKSKGRKASLSNETVSSDGEDPVAKIETPDGD